MKQLRRSNWAALVVRGSIEAGFVFLGALIVQWLIGQAGQGMYRVRGVAVRGNSRPVGGSLVHRRTGLPTMAAGPRAAATRRVSGCRAWSAVALHRRKGRPCNPHTVRPRVLSKRRLPS